MRKLLHSSQNNIVKSTARAIGNITADNPTQIQNVIDEGLFSDIVHVLQSGEFQSQKEAAWIITNVTLIGSEQQIMYLIETAGVLKPFFDLLSSKDANCILSILSGLKNLFTLADKKEFLEQFLMVCVI